MVQYVWEAAVQTKKLRQVIVATDSPEVVEVVKGFGGDAVLTPGEFASGTDRVAFVAQDFRDPIVLSLQADEPLLTSEAIDRLVLALEADPGTGMATLGVERRSESELRNPNIVKVVRSEGERALYFSRQPLASGPDGKFYKHIGIYAYRREVLKRFCAFPPSRLEKTERLEQLRALENGIAIRVVLVSEDTIAVDVPSDVAKVEDFLNRGPSSTRRV